MLVAVLDRGNGWEVWSRVSAWVLVVVSDRVCGRKVLRKVSLAVLLVWFDRGIGWEVSVRVYGMGCWWLEGVAELQGVGWGVADGWKVSRRVSPGVSVGVLLVVYDCYVVGKCCPGCNWCRVLARIWVNG